MWLTVISWLEQGIGGSLVGLCDMGKNEHSDIPCFAPRPPLDIKKNCQITDPLLVILGTSSTSASFFLFLDCIFLGYTVCYTEPAGAANRKKRWKLVSLLPHLDVAWDWLVRLWRECFFYPSLTLLREGEEIHWRMFETRNQGKSWLPLEKTQMTVKYSILTK